MGVCNTPTEVKILIEYWQEIQPSTGTPCLGRRPPAPDSAAPLTRTSENGTSNGVGCREKYRKNSKYYRCLVHERDMCPQGSVSRQEDD